jgi:hypothetical protein
MKRSLRRPVLAVLTLALLLAGLLVPATAATAQPVETGSLIMTSDPGDFVGGGQSCAYSTAAEDFWNLDFAAPPGSPLTPGTYLGATRASFRGPGEPGLDVFGNGRGCSTVTGSFVVTAVSLSGPDNSFIERFDATFEQHCEGGEPALRGEIHIANPPPPAPLELSPFTVAANGTVSAVSGRAIIRGTVGCTQPVAVSVDGNLAQVV